MVSFWSWQLSFTQKLCALPPQYGRVTLFIVLLNDISYLKLVSHRIKINRQDVLFILFAITINDNDQVY